MRASAGRRVALIVWSAFAFVTWNVVFDRQVYLAAVEFTQQQIERQQRGEPVSSIDAAFRPRLREAAARAFVCGGSVLVAGIVLASIVGRQAGKS